MIAHSLVSNPPPPDSGDGVALVVLAAGDGTRMRSGLAKPLHPVAGLPMVLHVLRAGAAIGPLSTTLVVGRNSSDLAARIGLDGAVRTVIQDPPLGTGDAVRRALPSTGNAAWIVMLFADHPLLTGATVVRLVDGARNSGGRVTVLSCVLPDAQTYGRVQRDEHGRVVRIVEFKDDDPADRRGPTEINSGMMVMDAAWARDALDRLEPSPASGEYYVTELVALAVAEGAAGAAWPVAAVQADPDTALGINDRRQLATADAVARRRIRDRLLDSGVTLVGPETIFVDEDVVVGPDTTILPFTVLRGATTIGSGCEIGPQAVLDGVTVEDGVRIGSATIERSAIGSRSDIGPYAHLRPGTIIGSGVHVGNYAEIKNARIGDGARVGHVSYIGDASVGARTNIGAGTITANYDGVAKHRTDIGEDAFIGSDTILRAPVRVGDRAVTGAGSVVTRDVPPGATAVGVPARIVKRAPEPAPEPTKGDR